MKAAGRGEVAVRLAAEEAAWLRSTTVLRAMRTKVRIQVVEMKFSAIGVTSEGTADLQESADKEQANPRFLTTEQYFHPRNRTSPTRRS